MDDTLMTLKIHLPFRVFLNIKQITRIVVETSEGAYGFWPHRLDCVAALVPGIFTYQTYNGEVHYVAVDEGVLIKAGAAVSVSVRNAIGGVSLGKLRETVDKEFISQDQEQQEVRATLKKMENVFIDRFDKFRQEYS